MSAPPPGAGPLARHSQQPGASSTSQPPPPGSVPLDPPPGLATPPRKPHATIIRVVILVFLLAGLVTGFLIYQANEARKEREAEAFAVAAQTYTAASTALHNALTALNTAQSTLETHQSSATTTVDAANTLLTSAIDGYVSADATIALDTSLAALRTAIDGWVPSTDPIPTEAAPLPAVGDDVPAATQAALDKAAAIAADTTTVTTLTALHETQSTALADGVAAVTNSADALLASVPTTSQSFLDGNPIATNKTKVDMTIAAANLSPTWTESSSTQLTTFVTAAQAVVTSQAERTDLLAHPINPNRAKVEKFSLSLAGGTPIDFLWAPVVNGFGRNGTAGGTSTFSTNGYEYSYSEMNLSNNIAEQWPDFSMKALVAHETGHSITGKPECYAMMEAEPFAGDIETFATAWAIGQGFDDHNGSGEWLYGRPTDEQITVAQGCR